MKKFTIFLLLFSFMFFVSHDFVMQTCDADTKETVEKPLKKSDSAFASAHEFIHVFLPFSEIASSSYSLESTTMLIAYTKIKPPCNLKFLIEKPPLA